MMTPLLTVENLSVSLPNGKGDWIPVIHEVSMDLNAGQALAVVGESGSGKSMTVNALARLLPKDARIGGSVTYAGQNVLRKRGSDLREYRRHEVSVIFQNPRTQVNPLHRIGDFLTEALRTNDRLTKTAAERRVLGLLEDVGIDDPERRMRQFPQQLSGGLLQRVMIAAVLAVRPKIILADEPTTALDVSTQAEVMAIMLRLQRDYGISLILITHDLGLAAAVSDRIAVMYAGSVVEVQRARDLLTQPLHPYTAGLLAARPDIAGGAPRLTPIPGRAMTPREVPDGCAFADRCAFVEPACRVGHLPLRPVDVGVTRCRRTDILPQLHAPEVTSS